MVGVFSWSDVDVLFNFDFDPFPRSQNVRYDVQLFMGGPIPILS